jgi:hypothetical protein
MVRELVDEQPASETIPSKSNEKRRGLPSALRLRLEERTED